MMNTYAFLDSGSTVSFIDQRAQKKLPGQGTDWMLNIAGIHGTKDLKTEGVPLIIGTTFKDAFNRSIPVNLLGKHKLLLLQIEAKFQSLECFAPQKISI